MKEKALKIKYNNEEERMFAIEQVEAFGCKEDDHNRQNRENDDNCIAVFSGNWADNKSENIPNFTEINLKTHRFNEPSMYPNGNPLNPTPNVSTPEVDRINKNVKEELENQVKPHDFNDLPDTLLVTVPKVGTFLNIDPEMYERQDQENGDILLKKKKSKSKIIEVVGIGYPKCIIQREGQPITELIEVEDLAEELAKKLDLISYE